MAIDTARVLQSIAQYTAKANAGQSSNPMRLAVIDPAYTSGAPKVTFEGEDDLSTKTYPTLSGYVPTAGDRVWLAPIGNTYLVVSNVVTTPVGLNGSDITTGTVPEARLPQVGSWTNISLGASATFSDTSYDRPAFCITPDGRFVHLRGLIRPTGNIADSAVIATISTAAAQPPERRMLGVLSGNANIVRVDLLTNGQLINRSGANLTTTNFLSLDGLGYTVDTTT